MPAEFIWIMFVLKIPLAALLYLVWYATREPDPEPEPTGEGGTKTYQSPHPRPRLPRGPRRGPHGAAPIPAPPRTRTRVARARQREH
jgi:hypothetical protein